MSISNQSPTKHTHSIDTQRFKVNFKHKMKRHYNQQLQEKKLQLKTIRLNQHVLQSPTATSIINLQFAEEHPSVFKRTNYKKLGKKNQYLEERRSSISSKQSYKVRYNKLLKESGQHFVKNTMQIIPYLRQTAKDQDINDPYVRRRYYNMEKIAFPLKDLRKELSSRYKYRTLMSKSNRNQLTQQKYQESISKTDRSETTRERQKEGDSQININPNNQERQSKSSQNVKEKSQKISQSMENVLYCRQQINSDYKKQISTLIPIRKPSNKKDYFIFGMADRSNNNENKLQIYRDLLWKVNYSNGLYVHTPQNVQNPYKFYVGQGNNSNLISGILKRRFWWTQAAKQQEGVNFIWTQLKINSFFDFQEKTTNIPEYFIIQRIYSEVQKVQRASSAATINQQYFQDPNKRLFGRIDYKIWKNHLSKNEKTEKRITQTTYQKRIKMYQKKKISKIENSYNLKVHNHLEQNYYIGNKKALFYNVKRYLQLKGQDPFKILPLTFHITKGIEDPEYNKFIKYYQQIENQKKTKKNIKNAWIVKPGQNTNRGNGITVCFGIDDIKLRLKGKQRNSDGKLRTFIIQKYIQNPLLYNKRKFDLRHYILISCINGSFKGYWYDQGYVRTSSSQFNIKSSKDPTIHLTNDAVQKYTPQYGKYEKANKLTYAQLQKYIQNTYPKNKNCFYNNILPKMKQYATQSIKATYLILDQTRKKHNFELFGLDFMIDENFEPWLIQVNTNPCLELCCPHLRRLIPSVVQNMFKICLDPLFPPPQNWPSTKKPFFGDDSLNENKFELIFDEGSEGKQIQKLFAGLDKIDKEMGKIEQDNQTFQNEGQVEWQSKQ